MRLLRSQLRTKSSLKVIDADILPLMEVAQDQAKATADDRDRENASPQSTNSGDHQSSAGFEEWSDVMDDLAAHGRPAVR